MAIQSSVLLLLASVVVAAQAFSGLRRSASRQEHPQEGLEEEEVEQPPGFDSPAFVESGALPCPNKRFPCGKFCKVMNGPHGKGCKEELDRCDIHWKGHDPLFAPNFSCQMAKCLAACQKQGQCSTSLGSAAQPTPLALCTNACLSNHLKQDHHLVYADNFGDAPDTSLHECMMKHYFDPRPAYGCPNERFPCKDRCEVMHHKCQDELTKCDAATKPGGFRSHGRCEITVCFAKCGCGHSPGGSSMACHDKCLKAHNNPGDFALKTCVFKNTKWLQRVTKQQAVAGHR